MNQAVAFPAGQMTLGRLQNRLAVTAAASGANVVANEAEHATQPRFLGRTGDRSNIGFGSRAGIDDGGKATAQGFKRRQLARQIDTAAVERRFERNPDPPKNFRRLAECQRLAEALGQMMMRVDK